MKLKRVQIYNETTSEIGYEYRLFDNTPVLTLFPSKLTLHQKDYYGYDTVLNLAILLQYASHIQIKMRQAYSNRRSIWQPNEENEPSFVRIFEIENEPIN